MDDALPPPRRRRNWLLIVSLCANVALIAFVAVALYRAGHMAPGGPLGPVALSEEFPQARPALQHVVDAHAAKIAVLRATALQARHDAFYTIAGPAYSPQKMRAALAAVAAADRAVEDDDIAAAGEALAALTPQERQMLVDRVKRRSRFWLWRESHRH